MNRDDIESRRIETVLSSITLPVSISRAFWFLCLHVKGFIFYEFDYTKRLVFRDAPLYFIFHQATCIYSVRTDNTTIKAYKGHRDIRSSVCVQTDKINTAIMFKFCHCL